ncbi:flavin reductase family protein [Dyella sp.]|uniref:flavin reductase family protein n=1 Tax=Dyella sp. TaxID=1869338 RepID=UPI002ED3CBC3
MHTSTYYYEPAAGHGLAHDPFNAIVGPRPIGWVSTVDGQGHPNLAPYSFFNAFNYAPPIIGFASNGWKDSVANIQETGEFVWNLATEALAQQMNLTSALLPREDDEFAFSGLTPAQSRKIGAPRVLESPVNFECRLSQLIQLQGADGQTVPSWLVLGEVVAVHIDRALIDDGVYNAQAARPILRWGGRGDYIRIAPENIFEMIRPG